MKRIRFELSPELLDEANRVARVEGISFAAVVTRGLELLLDGFPDEPAVGTSAPASGLPADSVTALADAKAVSTEESIPRGEA